MIETNTSASWSVYKINDIDIFFKHSKNPRTLKKGGRSWTFSFTSPQISKAINNTHLALICGDIDTTNKEMEIYFIESDKVVKLLSNNATSITVNIKTGKSFRVSQAGLPKTRSPSQEIQLTSMKSHHNKPHNKLLKMDAANSAAPFD